MRTTKTVWPLRSAANTPLDGDTLEDDAYRAWILELKRRGFEIRRSRCIGTVVGS